MDSLRVKSSFTFDLASWYSELMEVRSRLIESYPGMSNGRFARNKSSFSGSSNF